MKRKIAALFVMALFIMSMVPLAFAKEGSDDDDSDDEFELEIEQEKELDDGQKLEPIKLKTKIKMEAKDLRGRQEKRLKLREDIRATSASVNIRSEIKSLRAIPGPFDNDNSQKAVTVVEQLIKHLELLVSHYDAMLERLSSSAELQETYPNAEQRITSAQESVNADITALQKTLEDNKLTRDEWQNTILPIIKNYGKQRSELRSNEQFREIRNSKVTEFVDKFKKESIPKVRSRLKERGLVDAEVEQRISEINSELVRLNSATNADRMAALNRIRQALA